jgi:uncharacterized protein
MKIVVLSDIHDNIWNLKIALENMPQTDAMICCGDLCSPFIIGLLAKSYSKDIYVVFGNNDGDLYRITQNASKFAHVKLCGEMLDMVLDNQKIAVNHYPEIARPLALSGQYDLVCYGHNHIHQIETIGNTLLINPGTMMGYNPATDQDITPSLIIYDTKSYMTDTYHIQKGKLAKS